jgi:hypothetical protein
VIRDFCPVSCGRRTSRVWPVVRVRRNRRARSEHASSGSAGNGMERTDRLVRLRDCNQGTAGNAQAMYDTVTRVRFAQVATAGCKDGACREGPPPDSCIATNCGVFDQFVGRKPRRAHSGSPAFREPSSMIACCER